ncbi:glycosyl transferase, group 1 [Magnetococcus marinus MC-1]|uniref:Glycosyl transferase, group 1 n=1 Tax=Magnetococcus marinus (strain ATCC BAA-1437 / JCM 17883 / MC-1) TaxID=156889 RepID=A0L8Y8_MAGMM|nr:glycosyltransferase family 4 protein [Magnetococcus marinus]ABK44431.1 glycosyl transferase, group 1 [Magnetococcus marinus MC-1]
MVTAPRPLHIVHTEASMGWGGQEIRILTESKGLMERGHRVSVLCAEGSLLQQQAADYGVVVTPLPIGRKGWRGLRAISRWLREHEPDVIVTHSSTDSWLTALAARLRSRPIPVIRLRHISAPVTKNLPTKWLYGTLSQHVITTGELICDMLVEYNGLPREHVTAIPTGIDLEQFQPGEQRQARAAVGLPEDLFIIGIVATLRSWKGHLYLFDAFSKMATPNMRLLVVGDGPEGPDYRKHVHQLGIQEQVLMVGQQRDVVPWLRAMDLFCLPSYANEGVPQALMQAMACGLPCVTTTAGSMGEIVYHGRNGLLVPPKRSDLLAQVLLNLAEDPVQRDLLATQAAQDAKRQFGLSHMLARMEQQFYAVLP